MGLINNDIVPNLINRTAPFVIGIGASAGGLEVIYTLFEAPFPDNASFVIVQHFPPGYKSNIAELLSHHSKRKVVVVKNKTAVEPGVIYVIGEKKNVAIKSNILFLIESEVSPPNKVIDFFFHSLAEDQGSKSIAVILSGANNDGTEGAEAIKKAGGFVIVQDPETTSFDSMPLSAITSGYTDLVLAPRQIMEGITNHLKHIFFFNQFIDNNEAALQEILKLIRDNSPFDFTDYKRTTLIRRIIKRMIHHRIEVLPAYINLLKTNAAELDILSKEFLISVTNFFRDPEAFEIVKEKVLPSVIQNKLPDSPLKVWSIGCATGEEAYSLAILIDEYLTASKINIEVKIFASDVDKEALTVASKGIYSKSAVNDISGERLNRYFRREAEGYQIHEHLRRMIIFAQHDVTRHPPYYKLDLIACRNVLIYFNPVLQQKVLSTLHFCLNKGGYLFLGPSENIGQLKSKFSEIDKHWKIYKNIKPETNLYNTRYAPLSFYNKVNRTLPALNTMQNEVRNDVTERINLTLLEELNYAGVCIDSKYKILKTLGDYSKYLLPEMFNFNLLELLPHDLSTATALGVRKAVEENRNIYIKNVKINENSISRFVDIRIKILPESKSTEKIFIVLFKEQKGTPEQSTGEVYNNELFTKRYLANVETELKETREKLQEAEDVLALSIDNAQSYNEELISNNEELQSTNEEVQSINEELQTVNNEYQQKIRELAELNDDLNNYFRSTTSSQLYVDKSLIIRKFTPAAFKQINLKEGDVGRHLNDISTNIKFSSLINDIKEVIDLKLPVNQKEIQTLNDKWYQMVIMPYIRRQNNMMDGAVITFNDITELKTIQGKMTKIIQDHDTFIYSVSHDLKNQLGNILLSSELLHKNVTNTSIDHEGIKKLSTLIHKSVKKLANVITELTDVTQIEKEIWEGQFEKVNIPELLEDIKFSIKNMLIESNAVIKTDLKVMEVKFMKKNLRSILLNLITNAVKYKSPDREPEIIICTNESEKFVILTVQDNGIGMSEEQSAKIFSRFKRIHNKSTMGIEGTGIGLYLIHRIITNEGGEVHVNSEPGKGSIFTVMFKKN